MRNTNTQRIAKNTAILYLRMLFQMVVFLFTLRVVMQTLGEIDYGIYDVVAGIVGILIFLNNSLTTCTQRYITYALGTGDEEYLNRVYSQSIIVHIMMALAILVIGETIGLWYAENCLVFPADRLTDVRVCYQCSLGIGVLVVLSVPYNATIIAYERMQAFAAISIIDVTLKFCVALLLYFGISEHLLSFYSILMLSVALIIRISYSLYCRYAFPQLSFVARFNPKLLKEMLAFAGWSTFGNMSIACNVQGMNLLLNYAGGPIVNAARGVAFYVQTAINQFVASFQMAVNPQITKCYAQGEVTEMNKLILAASRLSYMLLLFMAVPLELATPWILELWLGTVPNHTVPFVRLLIAVTMVDAIANPIMVAAAATGNIKKYHLTVGTTLLTALPLATMFVLNGACVEIVFVVLLIVTIIAQVVRLYICRTLINLSIKSFVNSVFIRTAAVTILIFCPLIFAFRYVDTRIEQIVAIIVSELWALLMIVATGITTAERKFVINKVRRLF